MTRESSDRLVKLAQKAMRDPTSLSAHEVRSLAGSVLSQAEPGKLAKIVAKIMRTS